MEIKHSISRNYWPEFYDDELLYSVIARFGRHAQIPSTEKINGCIYGRSIVEIIVDLPEGLDYLASVLPAERQLTAAHILRHHTLYNYYSAFIEDSKREELSNFMMWPRMERRSSRVRRKSAVGSVTHLRFCRDCLSQMVEEHGEAYWKREHQLPTVLVCVKHNCLLSVSSVFAGTNAREYTPLTKDIQENDAKILQGELSEIGFEQLIRIAQASVDCLRNATHHLPNELNYAYRTLLYNKGFAANINKIYIKNLEAEADAYARTLLPVWPDIISFNNDQEKWFKLPIRIRPCKTHPAYHLIFQDFVNQLPVLGIDTAKRSFWKRIDVDWPCYNPIAQHDTKPTVKIVGSKNVDQGVRTRFKCECGYAYNRTRRSDGTFGRPTITCYGPTLIPLLTQANKEGWSMNKTSKMAGIKAGTVIHQAKKLGFSFEKPRPRKKLQF